MVDLDFLETDCTLMLIISLWFIFLISLSYRPSEETLSYRSCGSRESFSDGIQEIISHLWRVLQHIWYFCAKIVQKFDVLVKVR